MPPLKNKINNNKTFGKLSLYIVDTIKAKGTDKPECLQGSLSQRSSRPSRFEKYLPLSGPGKTPQVFLINQINWRALKTAKPSAEFKNGHSFR